MIPHAGKNWRTQCCRGTWDETSDPCASVSICYQIVFPRALALLYLYKPYSHICKSSIFLGLSIPQATVIPCGSGDTNVHACIWHARRPTHRACIGDSRSGCDLLGIKYVFQVYRTCQPSMNSATPQRACCASPSSFVLLRKQDCFLCDHHCRGHMRHKAVPLQLLYRAGE